MSTLDRAVNNDFLMISKSLLPYMKPDRQRPMAIVIKAIELVYTINLFSNEDVVRSMSRSQETGWEKNFLNDVKANLSSDRAYFIDAILKIAEAKDLLSYRTPSTEQSKAEYNLHSGDSGILADQPFPPYQAAPNKVTHPENTTVTNTTPVTPNAPSKNMPNPNQIIEQLSPLLEPSQVQLLKVLSSFIK